MSRTLELKGEDAKRALEDATLDEDTIRVLKVDFRRSISRSIQGRRLSGQSLGYAEISALAEKVAGLRQLQSLELNLNSSEIGDAPPVNF